MGGDNRGGAQRARPGDGDPPMAEGHRRTTQGGGPEARQGAEKGAPGAKGAAGVMTELLDELRRLCVAAADKLDTCSHASPGAACAECVNAAVRTLRQAGRGGES